MDSKYRTAVIEDMHELSLVWWNDEDEGNRD